MVQIQVKDDLELIVHPLALNRSETPFFGTQDVVYHDPDMTLLREVIIDHRRRVERIREVLFKLVHLRPDI
jgi:hypothetical protein